jgi:hypothetical protein
MSENTMTILEKMMVGLRRGGFQYPMQFFFTSPSGYFGSMRVHEDGTSDDECKSEQTLITYPITIEVFDRDGKHHTHIIVDGDTKTPQYRKAVVQ